MCSFSASLPQRTALPIEPIFPANRVPHEMPDFLVKVSTRKIPITLSEGFRIAGVKREARLYQKNEIHRLQRLEGPDRGKKFEAIIVCPDPVIASQIA